ncbi:DUF2244 domain-containing protein [Spongiibacter sp. KMU-158]|uniref:DUF2244 domain-containing protein n=1 Tax=Spongiibacter pelagi TaxID=2760804 RepID=A0A927C4T2_9GAMM|nr:DUF2244 domain-containing protein [Spongiibacter pelagi]MBD2859586.1 DUF2244 domain-containing protein [Spongiibacter pelagi]
MVTCDIQQQLAQIILKPNCSADWSSNRRVIAGIAAINTLFATGFIAIGAWMILPFMGLELFLLWWLLRRVFSQLQYRQVLKLDERRIRIESGFHQPSQIWDWPREQATVLVKTQRHALEPLKISVSHRGEEVALGHFLNKDDCQNLLDALRKSGLIIRQFSDSGELTA